MSLVIGFAYVAMHTLVLTPSHTLRCLLLFFRIRTLVITAPEALPCVACRLIACCGVLCSHVACLWVVFCCLTFFGVLFARVATFPVSSILLYTTSYFIVGFVCLSYHIPSVDSPCLWRLCTLFNAFGQLICIGSNHFRSIGPVFDIPFS